MGVPAPEEAVALALTLAEEEMVKLAQAVARIDNDACDALFVGLRVRVPTALREGEREMEPLDVAEGEVEGEKEAEEEEDDEAQGEAEVEVEPVSVKERTALPVAATREPVPASERVAVGVAPADKERVTVDEGERLPLPVPDLVGEALTLFVRETEALDEGESESDG